MIALVLTPAGDGFSLETPALPALALPVNSSCVPAIGNDYGFDQIFPRQLEALARSGDVAIGISTSGNSLNVKNAISTAKKIGLHTVGLTGKTGGQFSVIYKSLLDPRDSGTPDNIGTGVNLFISSFRVNPCGRL